MPYTTDDCKNFLVANFIGTKKSDWKRTKKYKDTNGAVCRDFVNRDFETSLKETSDGLILFDNNETIMLLPKVYDNVSMNERLFGGGKTNTSKANSYEEKFIHVLHYGIDWEAPEGERSSKDFAEKIDFNVFVKKEPNILNMYFEYMHGAISFIYDLDETYMPHHIITEDFDDSFVDMLSVINNIVKAYKNNNMPLNFDKEQVAIIKAEIKHVREMMSCEDEEQEEEAQNVIESVKKKLSSL